jgi:hypothetical protein
VCSRLCYLGLCKYTFAQRRIYQKVSPSLSDAYLYLYGPSFAQTSTLIGAVISSEIYRFVTGCLVPDVSGQRSGLIFPAWNKNQATSLSRNARNRLLTDTSSHPTGMFKVSYYCPNCRRHTTMKQNDFNFNVFKLLRHSPGSTEENQKLYRKYMPDSGVESGILQNRPSTLSTISHGQHHHMKCC